MKSSRKITLPAEMKTKSIRQVFKILQGDQKNPQILFVGGCVRNALLSEAISDIDLATPLIPSEVTSLLKQAGVRVIPTGLNHGTVTAVIGNENFQITTLRRDIETDGRRAVVSFTESWHEDASRRDFTLNTLLCDFRGLVYDPLGVGLNHLEAGKIIFVGDPEKRIREDYLRILRFFRFQGRYGGKLPDKAAFAACKKLSKGLNFLSKERVTQEILKIISGPNIVPIVSLMKHAGVLKKIAHPKFQPSGFNYLIKLAEGGNQIMGLLLLSALSKSGTRRIEKELCLTNKIIKQLDMTISYLQTFKAPTEQSLKLLLYRAGPEIAEYVLISRMMIEGLPIRSAKAWLQKLRDMERPVLPIRGQDLIDQGMTPGPEIKKTLEKFERSWIRNNFKPTI